MIIIAHAMRWETYLIEETFERVEERSEMTCLNRPNIGFGLLRKEIEAQLFKVENLLFFEDVRVVRLKLRSHQ